jgi:hypothetical protein
MLLLMGSFFLAADAMAARHCYEPDDDMSQASTIKVDVEIQGHDIDVDGDEDWVRFYLVQGGFYRIETDILTGPPGSNTWMELYDSSGSLVACDDYQIIPSEIVYDSQNPFDQESGFYYARIVYKHCFDYDSSCVDEAVFNPSKPACISYPISYDLDYDFQVIDTGADPATMTGKVVQSGSPVANAVVRVYDNPLLPDEYKSGPPTGASGLFNFGVVAGTSPVEVWVGNVRRYRHTHDIQGLYYPEPNGELEIGELESPCGTLNIPGDASKNVGGIFLNVMILFSPFVAIAMIRTRRQTKE